MVKPCSLLPMLIVAGVFPLSAHALDTVELNSPDGRPMLVSEVSASRPQAGILAFPYEGAVPGDTFGALNSTPVLQFPVAERHSEMLDVTSFDVTGMLEEIRLTAPRARAAAASPAAQFAAALAIVGLVARRRLVGR